MISILLETEYFTNKAKADLRIVKSFKLGCRHLNSIIRENLTATLSTKKNNSN